MTKIKSHKEVIIVSAVNYKLLHLCQPVQLLLVTRPLQRSNVFPKTSVQYLFNDCGCASVQESTQLHCLTNLVVAEA